MRFSDQIVRCVAGKGIGSEIFFIRRGDWVRYIYICISQSCNCTSPLKLTCIMRLGIFVCMAESLHDVPAHSSVPPRYWNFSFIWEDNVRAPSHLLIPSHHPSSTPTLRPLPLNFLPAHYIRSTTQYCHCTYSLHTTFRMSSRTRHNPPRTIKVWRE